MAPTTSRRQMVMPAIADAEREPPLDVTVRMMVSRDTSSLTEASRAVVVSSAALVVEDVEEGAAKVVVFFPCLVLLVTCRGEEATWGGKVVVEGVARRVAAFAVEVGLAGVVCSGRTETGLSVRIGRDAVIATTVDEAENKQQQHVVVVSLPRVRRTTDANSFVLCVDLPVLVAVAATAVVPAGVVDVMLVAGATSPQREQQELVHRRSKSDALTMDRLPLLDVKRYLLGTISVGFRSAIMSVNINVMA